MYGYLDCDSKTEYVQVKIPPNKKYKQKIV